MSTPGVNVPKKDKGKYGAVVRKCTCDHDSQEATYGKGMRVANLCSSGSKSRCTVCLKEQSV